MIKQLTDADAPAIAERAYQIYRARYPNESAWERIASRHVWCDVALSAIQHSHAKTPPSGGMEEAVAMAIKITEAGNDEQFIVTPPEIVRLEWPEETKPVRKPEKPDNHKKPSRK